MTWEQFAGALLALAVTALARLLNRWLPPNEDDPLTPHLDAPAPNPPPTPPGPEAAV